MKKGLVAAAVFSVTFALVLAMGLAAAPESSIAIIGADSPCPAAGCASGACHGFDAVPEPDGITEMSCPEAGCASTECHSWDALLGRYHQASDASLNLWILMPVALVVALVGVTRVLSRGGMAVPKRQGAGGGSYKEGGCHAEG